MRADTAAIGRITRHQVVEPGIRDEAETLQQRMSPCVEQIDTLHQHGPLPSTR